MVGSADLGKPNPDTDHGAAIFLLTAVVVVVLNGDNPFSFVECKVLSIFNPTAFYFQREITGL